MPSISANKSATLILIEAARNLIAKEVEDSSAAVPIVRCPHPQFADKDIGSPRHG